MLALVICCCMMSVGYFAIISKSIVEGRVKFEQGEWNVKFTDIKTTKAEGDASNYKEPSLTNYVVSFYALFKNVGDSMTYEVEVTNAGNLDAKLANVSFVSSMVESISFEYDGIEVGNILKAGAKKRFIVTVTYSKYGKNLDNVDNRMQLLLDWIQAS